LYSSKRNVSCHGYRASCSIIHRSAFYLAVSAPHATELYTAHIHDWTTSGSLQGDVFRPALHRAIHTRSAPVGLKSPLNCCISFDGTTLLCSTRVEYFWQDRRGFRRLLEIQSRLLRRNVYAGILDRIIPCTTKTSNKHSH